MLKVAVVQPYFLALIGYFHLINSFEEFIVCDNIQFSKKGWFHRNKFLQNGSDEYFKLGNCFFTCFTMYPQCKNLINSVLASIIFNKNFKAISVFFLLYL
jgi:hypothetical protein